MWIIEKWRSFTSWLDSGGKPAWIAAMVLGFIFFWPIGLIILFNFLTRGSEMRYGCCNKHRRHRARSTGNTAFDQYRTETIERLEAERQAFESFLDRLRQSRDRQQFDDFMAEYKTAPKDVGGDAAPA